MATDQAERRRFVALDLRHCQQLGRLSGPMARVCGLPALERTILVLGRHGYRDGLVLVHPADREGVKGMMSRLPGSGIRLRWIEDVSQERTLWPMLEAITSEEEPPQELLYWPGELTFGRDLPAIVERSAPRDGILMGVHLQQSVGPAQVSLGALQASPDQDLAGLERQLAAEGRLEGAELTLAPLLLDSPGATTRAQQALLASLRKGEDGLVARFDRYLSLAVSQQLLKLAVHPNAITLAAGLVGVVGGLLAAQGGHAWMLIGALLFQLNSVLDGIDGEVARAKLLESRTGQWLDTISDDCSNVAFVAGAAVGCYRTWGSSLYLVLGAVAAVGFVINAAIMYHYLITVAHSGDLNAFRMPWERSSRVDKAGEREPCGPTLVQRLELLLRRDFFVLLTTLFALVGQLRLMMWLYALGANAVWLGIVGYRLLGPQSAGKRSP